MSASHSPPQQPSSPPGPSSRRKSGRVIKAPVLLSNQLGVPAKRKRGSDADADDARSGEEQDEDVDMDRDGSGEEQSEEDEDMSEADPEENKERQRKRRARKSGGASSKRAVKKPKTTNGGEAGGVNLAMRPAPAARAKKAPGAARARKTARISSAADAGGLYAEVFGKGNVLDDVAAEWVGGFEADDVQPIADFCTFLFRCAGCEHKVESHDVQDEDNFPTKIKDVAEEYQAQNITEYPLISKSRGTAVFRQTYTAFLRSVTLSLAKSNKMFDTPAIFEIIYAWMTTLSNQHNRPFRHTSSVGALAIMTTLCEIGVEIAEGNAMTLRQVEGEKKKKGRVNKARVAELDAKIDENNEKEAQVKNYLQLWFDAVFVHRYRDVEFRIRVDCMQALAEWMVIYPDVFFMSSYLRYIGWVLSDAHSTARLEAVKALLRQYKESSKLSGLRTFTERFRPRLVEMATRDSDAAVRAVAIELLDVLREAGFLEPDDIDSIGRLIFDAEPRVRKAVVNFFAENVNDAYESRIEDLGGQEAVDEAIGPLDPDDEDFDSPRLEWLKMKCLVEMLQAYDAQDEVEPNEAISIPGTDAYMLVPNMESRFSLAAEVLCERIPELNWEILAGYLLHDHSSIPAQGRVANGSDSDLTVLFKQEVKLGEKEEVLLLEVLNAGVRLGLTDLSSAAHDKSKRLTKAQKMAEQEVVDSGSRHLASVIPRLLSKFGALPDAASAVLRLQHVLVPENQDSTAYGALLENVRKQFLAHAQPNVLEEASLAFLHARTGETDEIAAGKVTSLAEDAIDKISILAKGRDLSKRGNLSDTMLAVLDGTVLRLEKLGRIEDICDLLETKTPFPKKKNAAPQPAPVDALLTLLDRGIPTEDDADPVISAQEDSVTLHTTRALGFYFLWKVLALRKQVVTTPVLPLSTLETLAERKERFIDAITKILRIRTGAEEIRLVLTGALIDLHVAFASLLNVKPAKRRQTAASASAEPGDLDSGEPSYEALATEVPKKTQTLLLHILSAAEKSFAKRSKYSLKIPAEDQDEAAAPATDEEPEADSDAELADDEDIDSEAGPGTSADPEVRLAARLGAEQRLCEFAGKLVLGIWAGVIDGKAEGGGGSDKSRAVSKRLKRNRARLGANFKAVVDALERGGPGAGGRGGARKKTSAAAEKKVPQKKGGAGDGAKSKAIVVESDSEVDGNEADQELEDLLREDSPEKDDDVEEAGAAEAEVESLLGD